MEAVPVPGYGPIHYQEGLLVYGASRYRETRGEWCTAAYSISGQPEAFIGNQLLTETLDLVTHGDISCYTSTFADLRIFTPTSGPYKEFLQIGQVPEPSAIVLLSTAIALAFARFWIR